MTEEKQEAVAEMTVTVKITGPLPIDTRAENLGNMLEDHLNASLDEGEAEVKLLTAAIHWSHGHKIPEGGDTFHHEDGTHRGSARSAIGHEVEAFEYGIQAHLSKHVHHGVSVFREERGLEA